MSVKAFGGVDDDGNSGWVGKMAAKKEIKTETRKRRLGRQSIDNRASILWEMGWWPGDGELFDQPSERGVSERLSANAVETFETYFVF